MEITRTFDLLDRYLLHFNRDGVLNAKVKGQWKSYSAQEYNQFAHDFAYGLLELGFSKGDKIATISNNRPEWNFMDMGMAMAGITHVPIFPNLESKDYQHVLNHSDSKLVIVNDKKHLNRILPAMDNISHLKAYYTLDKIEGAPNWMEIVKLGQQKRDQRAPELESIKNSISEEDCATLIYTSGTTGQMKGVMLSHKNLVQNFLAAAKIFELGPEHNYLSILPLCHVGGRMGNYQTQYSGSSIYYAENMGTIATNMKEIA